jgi:hypothetical protein
VGTGHPPKRGKLAGNPVLRDIMEEKLQQR